MFPGENDKVGLGFFVCGRTLLLLGTSCLPGTCGRLRPASPPGRVRPVPDQSRDRRV